MKCLPKGEPLITVFSTQGAVAKLMKELPHYTRQNKKTMHIEIVATESQQAKIAEDRCVG